MKSIVLVALLAAGCSSKPKEPEGPSCTNSITIGVVKMATTLKARSAQLKPQMLEMMQGVMTKLQATLITRCTEDKWPAEALPCFEAISSQPEMRKCLDKLPPDQHTKALTAIRETMMSGMRSGMNHVPAVGGPGLPVMAGSGAAAPGSAAPPAGSVAPAAGSVAPPAGSVAPAAGSVAPAAGSAGSAAAGSGSASGW